MRSDANLSENDLKRGTTRGMLLHHPTDGVTEFHVSFLYLDCSQNDSRLTVFLTEDKRVFHVSILYLVCSGNGLVCGRLSYGQASKYRTRPTYYVTVLVFVCLYVCTTLSHPYRTVRVYLIATVWTGVTATVCIGVSTELAHLCTIFWSILSRAFAIYKYIAQIYLWWCGGWCFVK